MSSNVQRRLVALAAVLLIAGQVALLQRVDERAARAAVPGVAPFQRVWERTDGPIAAGRVARTWMWGPAALSDLRYEAYAESPGGQRLVQYFDKSRMEITNPGAPDDGVWYVTNGLLVVEMVTGNRQMGDATFEPHEPAAISIAGDPDDPTGPTYATIGRVLDAPPAATDGFLTQRLSRDGAIRDDPALARWNALAGPIDDVTGHAIAAPFWAFMTADGLVQDADALVRAPLFVNPYYATGRPISEAYWATLRVGGAQRDVLTQCFERRCLTWTPENPPEWRVEAGNVGQHYLSWQTGELPPTPPTPPGATATQTAAATSSATGGTNPTATKTPTRTPTSTRTPTPTKTPTVAPTATTGPQRGDGWFTDGTWNVGEDIQAGTYRNSSSSAGCAWARLSSLSAVIVENYAHEIQSVTIEPGDAYFRSNGCGTWTMTAAYPTPTPIPQATATPGGSGDAACLNGLEAEVMRLLNAERQKAGLAPLTNSRALNTSAYRHSLDMTTRDYYSQTTRSPLPAGQTGPTFIDRMRDAGYPFPASGWAAGENIAWGHTTAQALVAAWMASQSHKDAILNPLFTQVGIGYATNPDAYYQHAWTTDFANGNDGPGC